MAKKRYIAIKSEEYQQFRAALGIGNEVSMDELFNVVTRLIQNGERCLDDEGGTYQFATRSIEFPLDEIEVIPSDH